VWYLEGVFSRATTALRMERVPAIDFSQDEETTNTVFRSLNVPLKLFQRLFLTAVFLPLFLLGAGLMIVKKEHRAKFALLVIVPVYFMTIQPLIHTEYRYLLAVNHILLIVAAFALSWLLSKLRTSDVNGAADA